MRRFTILALAVAIGLGTAASPFASSSPDGLERVAGDQGFLDRGRVAAVQERSPAPDYGVPGVADKCPSDPETKNGFKDDDGCPDEPPRVIVTKTEVKITEKILFASGKSDIDPKSEGLLKDIAAVLKEHPEVDFIEVAGHADKVGTDPLNVKLTKKRAEAVVQALVKLGTDTRRMRAEGYGRYCPLAEGDGEEAREKNRRVEFRILRLEGKDTGIALGCEEASKKGIKPAAIPATAPKTTPAAAAPADVKPAETR